MSRTCLSIGVGVAVVFILAPPLLGDEYELQYKVLDLRQEGIRTQRVFRPATTGMAEALSAEPNYRSEKPLYYVARLGNARDNEYTIVFDESKGTGGGYDALYADRNNNEDLTDDPKIEGRLRREVASTTRIEFGPLEVLIDYDGKTVPYTFFVEHLRYHGQRMPGLQTMLVGLQPGGYYTGVVSFGESRHQIAVYDFNCNGLFNDYFRVRSRVISSGGRFHPTGDQVLIDVNGDGRFEAGRPDDKELYPHAKYVQVNGKWYSLDFALQGGKVDVQTPELKLGTIKVPPQSGSCAVQLLSENGIVTFHETGKEFQVPAGTYQLYAHTTEAKHSSENWRYEAWGKTSGEKLHVAEGTIVPLRFGQPLLVDVTYRTQGPQRSHPKAGDTISLSLSFSGQGGEEYTDIWKEGLGPPAPTYRIVDEAGKTVAEGTFRHD